MKTDTHFFIIYRAVLLRMRNVTDRNRRENQNTHFMFSNLFFFFPPKIVSFIRQCGKIL